MKRIFLISALFLCIYGYIHPSDGFFHSIEANSAQPESSQEFENQELLMNDEEINKLINDEGWDFKVIIDEIDKVGMNEGLDLDSLSRFTYFVLQQKDLFIEAYLSKYLKICSNLERIQKFLDIRFNIWVIQSRILPLLKKHGIAVEFNERTNRLEKLS